MKRLQIVLVASWLALTVTNTLSAATTTLTFNAPVPGTLNDANGLGTGFTARLPGTGSSIPTNDPNLDLAGMPGKLLLTATQAGINQFPGPTGANLSNLETPGVLVLGVGAGDIFITAIFENVNVPGGSDQLEVYAGVNENMILRAGVHETNVYIFTENTGSGDQNTFTGPNAFSTGDNLEVTLSRQSGLWALSWNNLTTATSGALPGVAVPWLDAQPDLYFGILATRTTSPFIGQIDYFSVAVPEPGSIVLLGFGAMALLITVCRRLSHPI